MRLWCWFAVAMLGCYRAPHTDEDCTIECTDHCPGGLRCESGYCVAPGQVCKPAFVHVAAGTGFACGIDVAGALWCWGDNARHQISPSDQPSYRLATRVDTTRTWQALDAGGEHVCGIADGGLSCWGANELGQVSDTIAGDVATPLMIAAPDVTSWSSVAAGAHSTCAIADRRLFCWGGAPAQVAGDDWLAVAIGDRETCAISEANGVMCWGASQPTPTAVGVMTATSVAVSSAAACATTSAGELVCWGSNGYGELGEANAGLAMSATPVAATATTGWTSVAASIDSLCGLRDGEVVCWGSTTLGGLGNGFWSQTASSRAFAIVDGTKGATALSLGWNERFDAIANLDARDLTLACAVVGSDIACWGDNRFGQLAMGNATMALTPQPIKGNPVFTDLQAGLAHGCGVEAGVVWCWGSTELGAPTGVLAGGPSKACIATLDCDVPAPKQLNFFAPNATDVALGAYHSCAFHAGAITCWGDSSQLQLVTSTPMPPRERDIPSPGGATWTGLVQTGRLGQCATYRSGTTDATACWGFVLQQRSNATPVAVLDNAKAIALGSAPSGAPFDCIVDATSTLQCQGDNTYGQYGNDTTNTNATLTAISPARMYIALATNALSPTMCGIRPDGGVECWGLADRGQTGEATGGNTLAPNAIAGLADCSAIAVGRFHACAICGGSIACWGDNRFGQLGTGTLDDDPQPMPRTTSGPPSRGAWVQLVAGYRFTCARSDAGESRCWGFDQHAALGNGARSANLPVLVGARPTQ